MNHSYLVVIEEGDGNYSAFSPDLPGCVATGDSKEKTLREMRKAILLHMEGLRQDGLPVPTPSSSAEYVLV